jgi:23S rRNA pseudouridine955/2504/2580 synthase/23S rRNA pseudouridine1911/1915/1917 synthase
VSRLDVGVSGVVTLARDAHGRELASTLRARGQLGRRYLALLPRAPEPAEGLWTQPVDGKPAETRYASVGLASPAYVPSRSVTREAIRPALVALSPVTGRTHQLRIHAASAGAPLLGDVAHGGTARLLLPSGSVRAFGRVCLHAVWVALELGAEQLQVTAPMPDDLLALWGELGGAPDDWGRALEIALPPGKG